MSGKKLSSALLSFVFVAGHAAAASRCAGDDAVRTLQVAAMQQQLMVAALTCHDIRDYNQFVLSYRPVLQQSDRDMLRLFESREGESQGFDDYNAFKTKLANVAALQSNEDGARFCGQAEQEFNAALGGQYSLGQLAASQPAYVSLPFAACRPEPDANMAQVSRPELAGAKEIPDGAGSVRDDDAADTRQAPANGDYAPPPSQGDSDRDRQDDKSTEDNGDGAN